MILQTNLRGRPALIGLLSPQGRMPSAVCKGITAGTHTQKLVPTFLPVPSTAAFTTPTPTPNSLNGKDFYVNLLIAHTLGESSQGLSDQPKAVKPEAELPGALKCHGQACGSG